MLPAWVEDYIRQVGELSLDRRANAWRIIAIVGEIVNAFPPRSRERREAMSLISDAAMIKKPTQHLYARLWAALKEGAEQNGGEVPIPQNIDPSTARCIIQHGGDYSVIARADAEGWTLAQARAWAADKAVVKTNERPQTLWRHLTKALPEHLRKATGPVVEGELLQAVREAVRAWNQGREEEMVG